MYVQGYSATYEISNNLLPQVSSGDKSGETSPARSVQADCTLCRHTSFPHSHEGEGGGKTESPGKSSSSQVGQNPLAVELSEEDQKELEKLKKRDVEVRQHEAAHKAAGGSLAGAPQLEYTQGPDGRQYVSGGHVPINTSKGRTPEETIARAETIRRAALAPHSPSSVDRKVAAGASKMEAEARAEIAKRNLESMKNTISSASSEGTEQVPEKSGDSPSSQTQTIENKDSKEFTPSFSKPASPFGAYEQSQGLTKKLEIGNFDFLG